MAQKLLLIDTDCGIDDAQAIMMALAEPTVKVVGITCCFGNTTVDYVCQNVVKVLSVCERSEIQVFRGACCPLVGGKNDFTDHFGTDGLGDVLEDRDSEVWKDKIQKEHAALAMIRLASENQGKISLVAVGPLTNLAMAVRLDPTFPRNLKDLYIMGGNMEGKGNMTPCAEFNFVMDPESAYVVLEEYLCPTHIATWEFTCRNTLPWVRSVYIFKIYMVNQDTAAAKFMKLITSKCWAFSKTFGENNRDVHFGQGFVPYDSFAVAACIDQRTVTDSIQCPVRVELQGSLGRGMLALDPTNMLKKSHSASVMKSCDQTKFCKLLMASLNQP
uniref:Inosine/uridine-preferring nucleoside hydrolase domain-containing protein n=1 Tax=Denticeps clupeoides TaxID=299321 RepID=A0AAY4C2W4_9TELE